MSNNKRLFYGLLITVVIFAISTFLGSKLNFGIVFIPSSFYTHFIMLLLSICAIYGFKKYVNYKFSLPELKKILKPLLFGLLTAIIVNFVMSIITKVIGYEAQSHPLLTRLSPLQSFIFVLIFASIAEELLFRGFLLNLLKPLSTKGFFILKRKISLSVIISAITFGLSHLILIASGVNGMFILRTVIFTSILGFIAGYYQEKYNNNAYAIIVHMAGNIMGVVGALLMNLNI